MARTSGGRGARSANGGSARGGTHRPRVAPSPAMHSSTRAPHGTPPALEGRDVATPMAMILAGAGLLVPMDGDEFHRASRAIYEATLEAVSDGIRTADLGGHAGTTDFTNEVVRRVATKLDVWKSLADVTR